jgi:hypothetical protein
MSARLAAAFTKCQIALGVIPSLHILSSRLTLRKIVPQVMAAAPVHSPRARFAHKGTGTVRMCFPLPIKVSDHPALFANLEILCSESN